MAILSSLFALGFMARQGYFTFSSQANLVDEQNANKLTCLSWSRCD